MRLEAPPRSGGIAADRHQFQGLTGGDTPVVATPPMSFTDTNAKPGEKHEYRVIAVNAVGLKSAPVAAR